MDPERIHIEKLIQGDRNSFRYLYKNWSGKLYNFVMRMSGNDIYLSEEIVQSVFIKIWEKREYLNPERSFSGLIFTMGKHMLLNIYEHKLYESRYQEQVKENTIIAENITEKEVDYKLLQEYLSKLIEELPPARRKIFQLSRIHVLSNKEIAEQLNLSEHTVESQLTKATAFLRLKLKQHYKMVLLIFVYFSLL